jgi:hypothetical protein
LRPQEAALHIDKLWDASLDNLPDVVVSEGQETGPSAGRPLAR